MAVKIRLARFGAKKKPSYNIVIANSTAPRDGDCIDRVGSYTPKLGNATSARISFDEERLAKWFADGAQPTDTVLRLMRQKGIELPAYILKQVKEHKPQPQQSAQEAAADSE